jgi:hypothetical protein
VATIEEITIIGLLVILLIFALRNHLMVNAMGQMTFGVGSRVLALVENLEEEIEKHETAEKLNNAWNEWDDTGAQ